MKVGVIRNLSAAVLAVVLTIPTLGAASGEDKAAIQSLYEKAKAEGEVVIWGPQALELEWIGPALAKQFPGIEVKWNADTRSGPKIIAEARAGKTSLDVFIFSMGGMAAIQQRGLLGMAPFSIFGTEAVFNEGQQGATHNLVYVVGYNTEKVKTSELPSKWADFTDPKWKNKLLASAFLMPRLGGFLAMAWGEKRTADWLRTLINDQNLMLTNAPRGGILKTGERIVSLTEFVGTVGSYAKAGIPADWKAMDVIGTVQFVSAAMKKAPHPNAAKLVAAWLTSDAAAKAREMHNGNVPIGPKADFALSKKIVTTGAEIIYERPENMLKRRDFYNALSPIVTGRKR